MRIISCLLISFVVLCIIQTTCFAQERSDSVELQIMDLMGMSLDELLQVKITIASKVAMTQRESPGIITVITEEEIINSGSRELKDILMMVPGFSFGSDILPIYGANIRGNSAQNGKILMLIDGHEVNESNFGIAFLTNRIDVEQISRIEVIRGPGSSVYGGMAEFGVINIITKGAEDLDGVQLNTLAGVSDGSLSRSTTGFAYGKKLGDLEVAIRAHYNKSVMSTADYHHMVSDSVISLTQGEGFFEKSFSGAIDLKYKGFSLNYMHDNYDNKMTGGMPIAIENNTAINQIGNFANLKYDWKPNDKTTISPFVRYKSHGPAYEWNGGQVDFGDGPFEVGATSTSRTLTSGVAASHEFNDSNNLLVGIEYMSDDFTAQDILQGIDTSLNLQTYAAYAQLLVKHKIANLTVGSRFVYNEAYGSAIAPRIGLTKVIDKFHAKMLYSVAYRNPLLGELAQASEEIKPEFTNVLEAEIGYQLTPKSTINLIYFDIHNKEAITFVYDPVTLVGNYTNSGSTGTSGLEAEFRYRDTWGYVTSNVSFVLGNKNEIDAFKIPMKDGSVNDKFNLGVPNFTFNLFSSFKLGKSFSINPSYHVKGKAFAYHPDGTQDPLGLVDGVVHTKEFAPQHFVNLNLVYRNLIDQLDLSFGVMNILNETYNYHIAYNNLTTTYPGLGRDFVIKVKYKI
ncbi:MAG: TonB-dependent receptor plug domain-containing protein [Reichenbachiella sp.]